MATNTHNESSTDLPLPEQDFVDRAYERLDALRASYRERQGRVHSTHGVGNAQGWTEREALSAHLGEMAARLEGVENASSLVASTWWIVLCATSVDCRCHTKTALPSSWTGVLPLRAPSIRPRRLSRTASFGAVIFRRVIVE